MISSHRPKVHLVGSFLRKVFLLQESFLLLLRLDDLLGTLRPFAEKQLLAIDQPIEAQDFNRKSLDRQTQSASRDAEFSAIIAKLFAQK